MISYILDTFNFDIGTCVTNKHSFYVLFNPTTSYNALDVQCKHVRASGLVLIEQGANVKPQIALC